MSMTRRAREQEEETMTRLLLDRGLLEPGMTYSDKKDLMSILKESENMAVEKTEDTDVEDMQVESHCDGDRLRSQSDEKNTANIKEEIIPSKCRKQPPRKSYSDKNNTDNSSDVSVSKSEVSPITTPNPKKSLHDVQAKNEEVTKLREKECDKTDIPEVTAGLVSTENMELDIETTNVDPSKSDNSDVDMLPESPEPPVSTKQEDSKKVRPVGLKKTISFVKNYTFPGGKNTAKDDGNINVFDATCNTCESKVTFQRKCIQAQERFPFFLLQQGITLDTFIGHFKKYVDRYRRNLLHIQRSSVTFLEWGKPIPVTFLKSSTTVMGEVKKADLSRPASSNSYNFRERTVKNKDSYSLSDSENFIDDSVIGIGPSETYIPDSSGSESDEIISRRDKRKSEQKEDQDWKQSSDNGRPSVSKRLKFSLSKTDLKNTEAVDSDDDFAPANSRRTYKRGGRRGVGRGRGTGTKLVETAKPVPRKQPSSRGKSKAVKALASSMEGCEDFASTDLCSQKSEEFDRLQQPPTEPPSQEQEHARTCSSPESKPSSQELCCRNSPEKGIKENSDSSDITFLGSTPSEAVQNRCSNGVMCPICGKNFTSEQIEMHASTCDLYPSDRSQHEDLDT